MYEWCDADANGGITKTELYSCLNVRVPNETKSEVFKYLDVLFLVLGSFGDGELSLSELDTIKESNSDIPPLTIE